MSPGSHHLNTVFSFGEEKSKEARKGAGGGQVVKFFGERKEIEKKRNEKRKKKGRCMKSTTEGRAKENVHGMTGRKANKQSDGTERKKK